MLSNILDKKITLKWIVYIFGGIVAKKLSISLIKWLRTKYIRSQVMKRALNYKQKRDDAVRQLYRDIPDLTNTLGQQLIQQILISDVQGLKKLLEQNQVTSEQLVNIFARRSADQGFSLSNITWLNYEEALQQAKQCDQLRLQKDQKCQGELFGIPISIKDTFEQKNFASTVGCTAKIDNICSEDGLTVKLLKMAGAIPFVRSNIPQCAMTFESVNFLFGRTKNPWNFRRATGGSSGGEGGLIASKCSPLGIGSDLGGSIRIPAAFCGVCGFKPTSYRVSFKGHTLYTPAFDGMQSVKDSIGPLAKYVDDLALLMKAILNDKYHQQLSVREKDVYQNVKPFDDNIYQQNKKYKIGYFKSLNIFPASPANQRAVEEAKQVLESLGHQLVEITMDEELVFDFFKFLGSDKGAYFNHMLKGEELIEEYKTLYDTLQFSNGFRKFLVTLLNLFGQRRPAKIVKIFKEYDSCQYRIFTAEMMERQEQFFHKWSEQGLDAILSPGFSMPALLEGYAKDLGISACYTFIWNVLNLPTGSIPITLVREDEQAYKSPEYNDIITQKAHETMRQTVGLPVGVQITTLPYEEEKCLNIMKKLETEIKFYVKHPLPN